MVPANADIWSAGLHPGSGVQIYFREDLPFTSGAKREQNPRHRHYNSIMRQTALLQVFNLM